MEFDINKYKGKYVMYCKTEKEAKDFCNYLDSIGRRWSSGESYKDKTYFKTNCNGICYNFNDGVFGSYSIYLNNPDFKILNWSDFTKKFSKKDLKSGDVIMRRNGDVEIVCVETGSLISKSGYDRLDEIEEDLTYKIIYSDENSYDIVAVRRPQEPCDCVFHAFDYGLGKLVYERKDKIKMTLEEICAELGKEIEIVDSH